MSQEQLGALPRTEPVRPRRGDLRLWCRAQRMDRTRAHFAKRRSRERRDWSRRA